MTDRNENPAIALGPRIVASGSFMGLYREGMTLIEDVAAYLDGDGRQESRGLSREAALSYATESMRLTTRLMQLASWLLLQRAANSGEMTREQVATEKAKVRLDTAAPAEDAPGWVELPEPFRALVRRSLALQALVRRLDSEIYGKPASVKPAGNPVFDQITLLKTAFPTR